MNIFAKPNYLKLSDLWLTLFIYIAIAILTNPKALALSPQQIRQISQKFTIQIRGENGTWGSGTIIKRERDTYYAATSFHVIDKPTTYQIFAPDRQVYALDRQTIKADAASDIAVIKFKSPKIYQLPRIGNSNSLKIGTPIYINGYSKTKLGFELFFRQGEVIANSNISDTYGLVYTNNSLPGMSGGGVFNQKAELIAVQGTGEVNQFYREWESIITGNARGISINTLIALNLIDLDIAILPHDRIQLKADDLYVWGLKKQKSQDYSSAIALYTRALKLNPKYKYAYYKRGDAYDSQGKFKQSFRDFSRAIEFGLRHPDVYNYRCLTRYKLGDYRGANKDCSRAIALDPNYYYAYANRADSQYSMQQYRAAIADYTKAIRLNPEPKSLYLHRGYAFYEFGKTDAAITDWQNSQKSSPINNEPYLDLAIAVGLYQQGYKDKALKLATSALNERIALANYLTIRVLGWGNSLLADTSKLFQDPQMRSVIARLKQQI